MKELSEKELDQAAGGAGLFQKGLEAVQLPWFRSGQEDDAEGPSPETLELRKQKGSDSGIRTSLDEPNKAKLL